MANEENLNKQKEVKYFSQANISYLLTQIAKKIKESHIGE